MKQNRNACSSDSHQIKGADAIERAANSFLTHVSARVKKTTIQGPQVIMKIEGERQKTRKRFETSAIVVVDRDHGISLKGIVSAVRSGLQKERIELPRFSHVAVG